MHLKDYDDYQYKRYTIRKLEAWHEWSSRHRWIFYLPYKIIDKIRWWWERRWERDNPSPF